MRVGPIGVLVGILSACAGPGAVTPADTPCPGSVHLVAEARALVDSVLKSGGLVRPASAKDSEGDALLGVQTGPGLEALAPAGTMPELITDRQKCEAAAYEILHTPMDARDIVVFRYGKVHIAVHDGDRMRVLTVVDESGQSVLGLVWSHTDE